MNIDGLNIGELIRDRRKAFRVSQIELSKLSGIANTRICDFEKGKREFSIERLSRVLKCLGLKLVIVEDINESL